MIREKKRKVLSGYPMIAVLFLAEASAVYWFVQAVQALSISGIVVAAVVMALVLVLWFGFFMVHPNEARVLQLFGAYAGTAREPGLRWANPFYTKKPVSVRVRNFESGKLKVNDSHGSPIEIAAVVASRRMCTRSPRTSPQLPPPLPWSCASASAGAVANKNINATFFLLELMSIPLTLCAAGMAAASMRCPPKKDVEAFMEDTLTRLRFVSTPGQVPSFGAYPG